MPAEKIIDLTDLTYYHNQYISGTYALDSELQTLSAEVDELITEGGEPNVIETVKVNGSALTPDANKAVDVTVPTAVTDLSDASDYALAADIPTDLSDLTNTAQDPYATQGYVDQNGGKIDVIKVNGTAQTITNKAVDITVPTAVSDLTNDSGYQTSSNVSTAISTALANSNDPYQTESDVSTAIASAVASAYIYKGSVATVADLPSSGNTAGDVYDVQATGVNYAWNGSAWDALGSYVDTSLYWSKAELTIATTAEIDAALA